MKNLINFGSITIALVMFFFIFKSPEGAEQSLQEPSPNPFKIVNKQKNKDGSYRLTFSASHEDLFKANQPAGSLHKNAARKGEIDLKKFFSLKPQYTN